MVDPVLQGTTLGHLPEIDWNDMVRGGKGYRTQQPQEQGPGLVERLFGSSDKTYKTAQQAFERSADKLQCSIDEAESATRELRGAAQEGSSAASQMSDAAGKGQTAANAMNTAAYSSLKTAQHIQATGDKTATKLDAASSRVKEAVGHASTTIDQSAETIRQTGEETAQTLHSASSDAQKAADNLKGATSGVDRSAENLKGATSGAQQAAEDLKGASEKFSQRTDEAGDKFSQKADEAGEKFERAGEKAEEAGQKFEEWNKYFDEWSKTLHAHYDGSWAQNRVTDLSGDATHFWNSAQQVVTGECNEGCSTAESFLNPYPRAYGAFKMVNPLNYSWTTWGIVGGAIGMYAIYATSFKKSVSVNQKVEVNVYNSNGGKVNVDAKERGYNQSAKVDVDCGCTDGISPAEVRKIVERELAKQPRTEARLTGDRVSKMAAA